MLLNYYTILLIILLGGWGGGGGGNFQQKNRAQHNCWKKSWNGSHSEKIEQVILLSWPCDLLKKFLRKLFSTKKIHSQPKGEKLRGKHRAQPKKLRIFLNVPKLSKYLDIFQISRKLLNIPKNVRMLVYTDHYLRTWHLLKSCCQKLASVSNCFRENSKVLLIFGRLHWKNPTILSKLKRELYFFGKCGRM